MSLNLSFLIGELELVIDLVQEDSRAQSLIIKLTIEDQLTVYLPRKIVKDI